MAGGLAATRAPGCQLTYGVEPDCLGAVQRWPKGGDREEVGVFGVAFRKERTVRCLRRSIRKNGAC
jgi:hypothetical protein